LVRRKPAACIPVAMGRGFHDFIDFNVEAERRYHGTFLVEHHFSGWKPGSAPLTLLTWLAARTTHAAARHRCDGAAVHQSVILAEQAATLDLMSEAASIFGVGQRHRTMSSPASRSHATRPMRVRGGACDHHQGLDVGAAASRTRALLDFNDILVEPPTGKSRTAPFWMGAGSPSSIRRVAERATICCSNSSRRST